MASNEKVIEVVSRQVQWWVAERQKKLKDALSDSMAINPLLLPIIFDLHCIDSFEELSDLLISAHLMTGHFTGFGKLVDEKILPDAFGTQKLSGSFRAKTPPFHE